MKNRPCLLKWIALSLLSAGLNTGQARAQAAGGTDSQVQASAGHVLFAQKCQKCHQTSGEAMGPPLVGDAFLREWDGKTARALYSRIVSTMPADDPGSLGEKDVIDIVLFVLQQNGMPAGEKAIASPDGLNSIAVKGPK